MMLHNAVVYNKVEVSFFLSPIMPEHDCGVPEKTAGIAIDSYYLSIHGI